MGKISYLHIKFHLLDSFMSLIILWLFSHLILISSPRIRPQLLPSYIFFILITFLYSIKIIPTSIIARNSKYANCKNSFSCGGINGFQFPFQGGSRDAYCGSNELQLTYQDYFPKFTINSVTYRILIFDSSKHSFTVARDDYFTIICPTQPWNNTVDSTVFRYNDGIDNITLLYGCSSDISVSGLQSQSSGSGGSNVYYDDGIEYIESWTSIVLSIFDTSAANLFPKVKNNGNLQDAINEGLVCSRLIVISVITARVLMGNVGNRSGGIIHLFIRQWGL